MVNSETNGGCETADRSSERIGRLQCSVESMLRFSSEATHMAVPQGVVEGVIPLLRKPPAEIDEAGEQVLWWSCDLLSQSIRPATLESATLAVQLADWHRVGRNERGRLLSARQARRRNRWWIAGTLVVLAAYVFFQAYAIGLGTALEGAKKLRSEIEFVHQQKLTLSSALTPGEGGQKPTQSPALLGLDRQLLEEQNRFVALLRTLEHFVCWTPLAPSCQRPSKGVEERTNELYQIEGFARITRDVVVGYIIPLLIGIVGASAYVMRQTAEAQKNNIYLAASAIRDRVRIVQGATFGALAGVVTAMIDFGADNLFEISVPIVALLSGYNSEIVFRLMDSIDFKRKPPAVNPVSTNPASTAAATEGGNG